MNGSFKLSFRVSTVVCCLANAVVTGQISSSAFVQQRRQANQMIELSSSFIVNHPMQEHAYICVRFTMDDFKAEELQRISALQNYQMGIENDPSCLETEAENQDRSLELCGLDSCIRKENHTKSKDCFAFSREAGFGRPLSLPQSCLGQILIHYTDSHGAHVEFLNLRSVYEKAQSRVKGQSRQRIVRGKVEMVVTFDAQIQDISVMVERIPEASRALCGFKSVQVALKVKLERLELNKQYFSVDLDSTYLAEDGCTPVYKLSTVDSERRNRFHLAIVLTFIDGTRSKTIYSRPFLIRSRKKPR